MALFPFNQNKKKEKDSNRHYYGCGREVVYASEWFFLFKAMVDRKKRLSPVATKWICSHVGSPQWHLGDVKQRSELEQSSNDTDTDTRLPTAMCNERKKGYGSLLLCSLVGRKLLKRWRATRVEGTRDERGEPCPHKASANFAKKRAFDSGEGMGSEDVRPYCARCVSSLCIEIIDSLMSWGLFVRIMLTVLTVQWWASPRSMSIKRSGLKKGRCRPNY